MSRPLAQLLVLTLAACEEGVANDPSRTGTPLSASVSGSFERLDDGGGWLGLEEVEVTTADGTCALTREIEAVEADTPCEGCALTLEEVTVRVADEVPDCGVDLEEDVPTVGRSIAFRATLALRIPTSGDVLVAHGDAWAPYSSGLLESGAFTYHHRSRVGGSLFPKDVDGDEPPVHRGQDARG